MKTCSLFSFIFVLFLPFLLCLTGCSKDEVEEYKTPGVVVVTRPYNVRFIDSGVPMPLVIRSKEELEAAESRLHHSTRNGREFPVNVVDVLENLDFSRYSVVIDNGQCSGSSEHVFYQMEDNVYKYAHATAYCPLPDYQQNFVSNWRALTGIIVDKLPASAKVITEYKEFKFGEENSSPYPLSRNCEKCSNRQAEMSYIKDPGLYHEKIGEVRWIFWLGVLESTCLEIDDDTYHITSFGWEYSSTIVEFAPENYYAYLTINNKSLVIAASNNPRDVMTKSNESYLNYLYGKVSAIISSGDISDTFLDNGFYIGNSLYLHAVDVERDGCTTCKPLTFFVITKK